MGDPARRLDDGAAGRGGARAGVPQAGTTGVRAGGSHRGWWRMGEVVGDGGGRDEGTSTNLHEPPRPPPTSAKWRSVNERPAVVCRELLAALDASEGRRRRRKRDTTPDAIGLTIKRDLLERAVEQVDRKSTRLNSSHTVISYAVFCLKKKKNKKPSSARKKQKRNEKLHDQVEQ